MKIKREPFPDGSVVTIPSGEELVDVEAKAEFVLDLRYYKQGIAGAINTCFVREGVLQRLLEAEKSLPKGYRFCIYDAYRPLQVQESLYDMYEGIVKRSHPQASDEEIERLTCFFVSKPSYDPLKPSVHNTGGAVDLTIVDADGKPLDMGTDFDSFEETAHTAFFEEKESLTEAELRIRENRRLLYSVMTAAGFTNLPTEWWHYDYGDRFYGFYKKVPAIYEGLINYRGEQHG